MVRKSEKGKDFLPVEELIMVNSDISEVAEIETRVNRNSYAMGQRKACS